ncbi:S1C family serine protease [Tenggerimyces flavus]|uniref:S1C family serine protease n=1 Tax=Tenggerimyces flavus TaxID=1708749 RepID=A0ABV7YNW1_9ACTN|nr:trypsin-like peptidase domain-containing protein [Tenggerimyces flavus]MBM7790230.1 S1-C subfamily serine protease [Tenggerimyces flavus]
MTAASVMLGVMLGVLGWTAGCTDEPGGPVEKPTPSPSMHGTSADPDGDTSGGGLFGRLPELVARVEPSVVTVFAGEGLGSGVVYNDAGVVVTNAHVVRDARKVELGLADGTRTPGTVLATDEPTDLAVIQADRRDLPAASFAATLPPRGELVVAIGSPLGFENSVTAGIVSGLGRNIPGAAQGAPALVDLIQTDAAISPGNSGGALLNTEGKIVGINDAYIPPAAGAVSLGFAIPAPTVTDTVDELLADGTAQHAYLGVAAGPLTPQVVEALALDVDAGAIVMDVAKNSPAATAGMRTGDVITAVADTKVDSVGGLLGALRDFDPGDTATMHVHRGGDTRQLKVTFGELPT